ncbi:diguanylate cyclase [Comamonas sp. GB3 AK4-5]|uniref:diguanylate cyclase n=1 Tax=Comamonas sp. GB3 AK4-5 TaxID=3231487 RepID=UPI00351DAC47
MSDASVLTHSQYQSVCDSLPDPTFILTESGRYAAILGGKDKRYYHDGSSLVGKSIADVLTVAKAQWFVQQIKHALASRQMLVVEYELSAHDVRGLPTEGPVEPIWFEGRVTALGQLYGGEKAVVWVASNITASKCMQQLLQQQAMCDELTGLPNRRRLMQVLEQAYADFCNQARSACLVSFDVDRFKAINDGLGHPAGDRALRDLAHAVQPLVAAQDWVCRLGGDEFAILCQGRTMADIAALAQQLLQTGMRVLQPYANGGPAPTLSLGMAHFQPSDSSMEDVMRRADQALYMSKTQGGHRASDSPSLGGLGMPEHEHEREGAPGR